VSGEANAGVRVPPPFIYLAGFLVGWGLQRLVTLPSLDPPADMSLGLVGIAGGLGLVGPSALRFFRAGTNLAPHQPTTALVFDGPYRFTRNPIYIGFAFIYAGAAIWSGITGALVTLPVVLVVIDRAVIAREERYLEAQFGDKYMTYKARVRRWL
jgi:protein-S-isoprenylcysteine O-methyltransferase Ste14